MARKRSAVQRYHDRVAGRYEDIYKDAYWQWHDGLTWDYLKKHLPARQDQPVVDLGCGSGKWGRRLLKSGYRVWFVDVSAKMVDEARRQVEQIGGLDKAEFVQAELEDLKALGEESFGLATAMGEPLCSTKNPRRALREIAGCLVPGGVLVATFDNRLAGIEHYLEKGRLEELERFLKTGRTFWLTRDPEEQFEMQTFQAEQVPGLLTKAGLELVEIVGKTVLPMRRFRGLLEDADARRRLARLEKRLAKDPSAWGRCAHLQVVARKPVE
jgi:SAM-dependent methyltransferase